jgi:hypothetical protein
MGNFNSIARAVIVIACSLFLGVILLSPAQGETIYFIGTDGPTKVSGTITFDYGNTIPIFFDGLLAVSTNAGAMVSVCVNGTVSTFQGIQIEVDIAGGPDASGQDIPSDRLEITWPQSVGYGQGISIYCSEYAFPGDGYPIEISFTDDNWWSYRRPYPVDYAVRLEGLVAPLSVYGLAPTLGISQTNGYVVLSYPSDQTGYVLESSPQPGTSWQAVTNAPVLNGANLNVTLPMTTNSLFFRLRSN